MLQDNCVPTEHHEVDILTVPRFVYIINPRYIPGAQVAVLVGVDVGNHAVLLVLERGPDLAPRRLKRLAVAAPGI